ncbi:MAG: hypothetical protein WBA57_08315 [Elainellaceae cyanobacterium]
MLHARKTYQTFDAISFKLNLSRLPIVAAATALAWSGAIAPGLAISQATDADEQAKQFAQKQFVDKYVDVEQFIDVPSDSASSASDTTTPSD